MGKVSPGCISCPKGPIKGKQATPFLIWLGLSYMMAAIFLASRQFKS